jgi:pyruvate carboxylase subunit B
MPKIFLSELVLRDGHQSLIATRMRTEDMLPACPDLDDMNFWSLEAWGGATFDACLRYLKEDPWERLKKLKRALPNTPIQMLLRGQNLLGYRHYPDDVVRAFVHKAAENGVTVFRIFDALNDVRNLKIAIEAVNAASKHPQGTICYTTSPVHTIERFSTMATELVELGCKSIAIKDMAGIMTPDSAFALVSAIKKKVSVPIHVHSHASAGLASMTLLKAAEAGATILDTCISAFSEGSSHPTTESMVAALAETPMATELNLAKLESIAAYFREVRKKYWQFESEYTGVDPRVLLHQVPGGMISNLAHQLKEQNALDRMEEVFAEIPRVRADLGYPPLVTPTSQIVGAQAVLNVLTGKRYQSITKEVRQYIQGYYGRPPAPINPELKALVLGNQEPITTRPADLLEDEMDRLKSESEAFAKNEEDVLTYAMFPEIGKIFLQDRLAGTLQPEPLLPRETLEARRAGVAPSDFNVTIHGETFNIRVIGSGHPGAFPRPYFVYVDGTLEEVLVETLAEVPVNGQNASQANQAPAGPAQKPSSRPRANRTGHVTTPMPGTVVAILKQPGDTVQAGDPVLVVEAMKMENEIQAPISGTVIAVYVSKGDNVTPDEALLEIQPG